MTASKLHRVESFVQSKAIKAPVRTETIAPITLSGLQTVNGVVLVARDRVLVKDQADATENGLYEAQTSAWNRAPDFDGERDATNGTVVVVGRSSVVALWQQNSVEDFTPGTDSVTFTLLASATLAGDLASTAVGLGASLVGINDVGGLIAATQVEAALQEIFAAPNETTRRVLEIATAAEIITGTDDVRAITPLKLAQYDFSQEIDFQQWLSNTVFADILSADIQLAASTVYGFDMSFHLDTDATPDFKIQFTTPDTLTLNNNTQAVAMIIDSGGTVEAFQMQGPLDTAYVITGSATFQFCRITGRLDVDAAGGFNIQGAQNASDPSSTSITQGGVYRMWKIR